MLAWISASVYLVILSISLIMLALLRCEFMMEALLLTDCYFEMVLMSVSSSCSFNYFKSILMSLLLSKLIYRRAMGCPMVKVCVMSLCLVITELLKVFDPCVRPRFAMSRLS
jgi:hypothetical protein